MSRGVYSLGMTPEDRITVRVAIGVAIGLAVLLGIGSPAPIRAQDTHGQGATHRADPCVHAPNPPGNAGNARGIGKRCPPSGGVAKGDFNGGSSLD